MYYVVRGSKQFGPYDVDRLAELVAIGQILKQDKVVADGQQAAYGVKTNADLSVRDVLAINKKEVKVDNSGSLIEQAKRLGSRIWISSDMFKWEELKKDQRLNILALVGLAPLFMMHLLPDVDIITFYAISLYFSCIWGLFYFYMFKTKQVSMKYATIIFFAVQALMMVVWGLGLNRINLFYALLESDGLIRNSLGYILGVGVTEELVKAIPLFYIATRSKTPLIPQTMVFYGVICGISFGVYEGVEYQMTMNKELDYNSSFFSNIARLTSLPFFHSMCSGLAGYFISFAVLKPRFRKFLYLLAIAMPAVLHGFYDVFADTLLGLAIGGFVVVLLNYYVNNDKAVQSALNESEDN